MLKEDLTIIVKIAYECLTAKTIELKQLRTENAKRNNLLLSTPSNKKILALNLKRIETLEKETILIRKYLNAINATIRAETNLSQNLIDEISKRLLKTEKAKELKRIREEEEELMKNSTW